ncbi:putative N-acetylgalactosaminyltransferase 9, partial [Fragariocoptes setiger]
MRNLSSDPLNRAQYAPLYSGSLQSYPSIWTLRLRRNKFTILKGLLLSFFILYLVVLYKSRQNSSKDISYRLHNNNGVTIDVETVRNSDKLTARVKSDKLLSKLKYDAFNNDKNFDDFSYDESADSSGLSALNVSKKSSQSTSSASRNHNKQHGSGVSDGGDSGSDLIERPIVMKDKVSTQTTGSPSTPSDRHLSADPLEHPKHVKRLAIVKARLEKSLQRLMPTMSGWGENGQGVTLKSKKEIEAAEAVFAKGQYNVYISDRISPNRTLRSVVAPACEDIQYDVQHLPNVSVIIIFTDEVFSALIRTIWSVINRTPKNLLHEIILVDDFSEFEELHQPLEDYIQVYWPTLVKLYRQPSRKGLIQARLKGAKEATGQVLLFLDSHCEATERWLEPLLARIKQNHKVFICPVIDIINDKTLEYNAVDPYTFQIGGFDWTGHFTWINRAEEEARKNPTAPVKSPTMAGGLFAVDRKVFFEFGSYDEDMQIWGGENLEISFRAWQCGGRVEIHPCSHVGHIFRDRHPYSFKDIDSHGINTLRTVLVWMDDYQRYFFMARPDLKKVNPGSLEKRLKLKKDLHCAPFKDYLRDVYENRKFIFDQNVTAYGFIRNPASNLCIDTLNRREDADDRAGLYPCEAMKAPVTMLTNQLFSLTTSGEIRREEGCLTAPKAGGRAKIVIMAKCDDPDIRYNLKKHKKKHHVTVQQWRHVKNGLIINEGNGECLTTRNQQSDGDLRVTACDDSDDRQKWVFFKYENDDSSYYPDPSENDVYN